MYKRIVSVLLSVGLALAPTFVCAEEAPEFISVIPTQIDARRESIQSSADEITISGTSYYVSADGSDANDGLSPQTPWKTVSKVNQTELSEGDGVFFRRGDLWRGDMITGYREGITYSAYGDGAKPTFYGSPENGSDAEKWTLWNGTDHIWVYEKPMPFLGAIYMNGGEFVATQHLSYWNGKTYTEYGTDDVPVEIASIEGMTYFSDVDLTAWDANAENHNDNGDLAVYSCNEVGTLCAVTRAIRARFLTRLSLASAGGITWAAAARSTICA